MNLGIVYHVPFWEAADGSLWELEGSFARYVDSLAPYFDEISLCVPAFPSAQAAGTRVRAANVRLAALPFFDGPKQFYRRLPIMIARVGSWVRSVDLVHCRVPTPAAGAAFLAARLAGKPLFLLVVGDLAAILPTAPYHGIKRWVWSAYTAFEERLLDHMTRHALTFANGHALARKHDHPESPAVETKTTTIRASDIGSRADTCQGAPIRLLTVSRIDPRKGLGCLPGAIAALSAEGRPVEIDIIGPTVGRPGERERQLILDNAARLGVGAQIRCLGAVPLDDLLPRYGRYDIFVLPTLAGEGIPRVLLEAMAAGLPVVTTFVSGIPGLVDHERNGLLVEEATSPAVARAIERVLTDASLRRALIRAGYETARELTLEGQAARLAATLSSRLGVRLRPRMATAS